MNKGGRPRVEDPRNKKYIIRLNKKEENILEETCELTGMGRSDVFRTALNRMLEEERFNDKFPTSPLLDKHLNER